MSFSERKGYALFRTLFTFKNFALAKDQVSGQEILLPIDEALCQRFIRANARHAMSVIAIDLDDEEALRTVQRLCFDEGSIPEPNFVVVNPMTGHAHVIYLLERSIPTANGKAVAYMNDVAATLRAAIPGSDEAYSGHLIRSPFFDGHTTVVMRESGYTLAELKSECIGIGQKFRLRAPAGGQDGRNCATFDAVRTKVYRLRRQYRSKSEFFATVKELVEAFDAAHNSPQLSRPERLGIARSIAEWAWQNAGGSAVESNFSAVQSERGRRGGARRQEALRAEHGDGYAEYLETTVRGARRTKWNRDDVERLLADGLSNWEVYSRTRTSRRSIARIRAELNIASPQKCGSASETFRKNGG